VELVVVCVNVEIPDIEVVPEEHMRVVKSKSIQAVNKILEVSGHEQVLVDELIICVANLDLRTVSVQNVFISLVGSSLEVNKVTKLFFHNFCDIILDILYKVNCQFTLNFTRKLLLNVLRALLLDNLLKRHDLYNHIHLVIDVILELALVLVVEVSELPVINRLLYFLEPLFFSL